MVGPLQTLLLRTESALTSAGNSGVSDQLGGKQLLADLTTIKGLLESLLGQANPSSSGSANDPNHVTGVGTFGGPDQINGLTHTPPKHDQ